MINSIISYSQEDLEKVGVYKILNLVNGKFYIGSTSQSFKRRGVQHYNDLVRGKHKNSYLKHSWNKYGENNFKFEIIEFCNKEEVLKKEQYWLDFTKSYDKNIGYNINPIASGTPNMVDEVIQKRRQTMLRKYASGELISFLKGKPAWNKGIPMTETWKENLRKPKNITEKVLTSRRERSERTREKNPNVLVYDYAGNYVNSFRSISDLASLLDNHNLPVVLVNKTGRNGLPASALRAQNISKCCNGRTKHYKGLQFRYENSEIPILKLTLDEILKSKGRSSQKCGDETSDELLGHLEVDNQQAS